jgi:hypothetical protein
MNGEAHQIRPTFPHIFPSLSPHEADEPAVSRDIYDIGIMGINREAMDVVKLIDRTKGGT